MHGSYTSEELKNLARVLSEILVEARRERPELSTDDVVQRVCELADRGERQAENLFEAVFGQCAMRPALS
jgi:hypothetical protein